MLSKKYLTNNHSIKNKLLVIVVKYTNSITVLPDREVFLNVIEYNG